MATTITRFTLDDDSGTPASPVGDGATIENQTFQDVFDAIDAVLASDLTLGGDLTLEGGDLDITGGLSTSGALTVGGATTLSGTLGVTGGTTLGGSLAVTGNTTLSGTGGNVVNSAAANAIAFFVRGRGSDNVSRILFQRFGGSLSQAAIDGLDGTLRIATGTTPTTRLTITDSAVTAAGRIDSATLQPGFLAYNSAADSESGSSATVEFDAELYDTTSSFASSVFTAPVTGIYHLAFAVRISNNSAQAQVPSALLVTSGATYSFIGPQTVIDETITLSGAVFALMTAGHTARVSVSTGVVEEFIVGGGSSPIVTYFCGRLVA